MRAKALFTYLGLTLLALFLAAPFIWMLLVSLHPSRSPIPELSALLPQNWAWENYGIVLSHDMRSGGGKRSSACSSPA
jgi:ABC-type glycerol-3-phosphate transport system permease component